jgi:class 3 adenylate cyclase
VREALRARIAAIRPVAAYGSAACGADILCLELVREMGGETHVVLPFPAPEFRQASVDFAAGDWGARFVRALAAAGSVTVTSDHRASGSSATFEYSNLVVTGLGILRARLLDGSLRALAAWDAGAAGAAGGAASLVPLWEARGIAIDRVDLAALRGAKPAPPSPPAPVPPEQAVRHEMRAMLFADAVGYSQLSEDQIPGYISGFLGAVAQLNARTRHRFEHVETSGDGLYMVFREAADAGHYALELNALVAAFDRKACGLPPGFDLRIALHCGPVHCARDPITGFPMYTGPHTSRAARIEPITPPGQVYASSAFAAVAAASGVEGICLDYVGRIPLAKGYGTLGLYHVRPAD